MGRFGEILNVSFGLCLAGFLGVSAWELVRLSWESAGLLLVLVALVACGFLTCWLGEVIRRWRCRPAARGFAVVVREQSRDKD
jgi:hypothetical protein